MKWKLAVIVIALILMGIFVGQNMEFVRIDFLAWRLEASRALIYLSIFVVGALLGWLGRSVRV